MAGPEKEPSIESRLAYEGKIINLRVDKIRLSTGGVGTREIVEHSDCVCMVPLDEHRNVVLVRQYRKAIEEDLLEVPAGGVEPGEVSEDAVLRELQEETGYTADRLRHLSSFWTTPGFCTELMHSYLATGLRRSVLEGDEDEDIQVVKVPLDSVPDMIESGEIRDSKSIASLFLVLGMQDLQDAGL